MTELMRALDRELDAKVYREIFIALAHACSRHLPDARARPYFERHREHPRKDMRFLASLGLQALERATNSHFGNACEHADHRLAVPSRR